MPRGHKSRTAKERSKTLGMTSGPLSRDMIQKWYAEHFRLGTLIKGMWIASVIKNGKRKEVSFLVVEEPDFTLLAPTGYRPEALQIRYTVVAFLDGVLAPRHSGLKRHVCDAVSVRNHMQTLTFIHAGAECTEE